MKEDTPLPTRCSEFEADAYVVLGIIAVMKGRIESVAGGMAYYEKVRAVYETIGNAEGASDAPMGLDLLKSMLEGSNFEELLKASIPRGERIVCRSIF